MPFEEDITLAIIGVNIILTLVLAFIYLRNYRAISSKLTMGLMFFAALFLVENAADFYFYNSLLAQSFFVITSFTFFINLIEMIGLLILLYITWK